MRFLPLLKLSAVVFLALACAAPVRAADVDPAPYFPAVTGNDLTMDVIITSPDGQVRNAIGRRRTEGPVEKDGKTYVRTRTWMEGLTTGEKNESTVLVRRDAKGVYDILETAKTPKEQVEVQFPLQPGATWTREDDRGEMTVTFVGVELVTINARKYENCLHFRTKRADGTVEDYWEAPKIGNIKADIVVPGGVKVAVTLREFRPAGSEKAAPEKPAAEKPATPAKPATPGKAK
jgi:hypothetical protein